MTGEGGVNAAVFEAARRAGCSVRQAEVLAVYVESETVQDASAKLGIAEQTAKIHLSDVRKLLKVPHTAAAVAKLVSAPIRSKH